MKARIYWSIIHVFMENYDLLCWLSPFYLLLILLIRICHTCALILFFLIVIKIDHIVKYLSFSVVNFLFLRKNNLRIDFINLVYEKKSHLNNIVHLNRVTFAFDFERFIETNFGYWHFNWLISRWRHQIT